MSSGALKFYFGFQKVTSEPLEYCDFSDIGLFLDITLPDSKQSRLSSNRNGQRKPQRDMNIVVPTACVLPKQNLSPLIHQRFGHVSIARLK